VKRTLGLWLVAWAGAIACAHEGGEDGPALAAPPPAEAARLRKPPKRMEYPDEAMNRAAQGDVKVQLCVDDAGLPTKIKILSDGPRLGAYVTKTLQDWTFPTSDEPCGERTFRFRIKPTQEDLEACDGGPLVTPGYEPPKKVKTVPPKYPEALARSGQEGDVILLVHLDADGDPVGDAELVSTAHKDLVAPARSAIKQWRWEPATLRGTPVRACLPARLEFRLRRGVE